MNELELEISAKLLRLARDAISAALTGETAVVDESLRALEPRGVFVTLRKHGELRGCIGTFMPEGDLPTTLCRIAVAATRDPRFRDAPLSASELTDIRIELSLLSPLEKIADPLDFEVGRHGLYLRRGMAVGCFLPDVAVEHGWDREGFLSALCTHKIGLHAEAWKESGTEIFRFTVSKIVEQ